MITQKSRVFYANKIQGHFHHFILKEYSSAIFSTAVLCYHIVLKVRIILIYHSLNNSHYLWEKTPIILICYFEEKVGMLHENQLRLFNFKISFYVDSLVVFFFRSYFLFLFSTVLKINNWENLIVQRIKYIYIYIYWDHKLFVNVRSIWMSYKTNIYKTAKLCKFKVIYKYFWIIQFLYKNCFLNNWVCMLFPKIKVIYNLYQPVVSIYKV